MYTIEKKSLCRYAHAQRMVDESLPEVIMNWLLMGNENHEAADLAVAQAVSHRGGPGSSPVQVMWDVW
jgi:hypothetical protein